MKVNVGQLREFIPDALPGMTLEVKDDFARNSVLVHVSYQRHAIVSLDMEALSQGEMKLIDELATAVRQASDILRDDVRKDVGLHGERA